uniref:BPL/LPL catalytic domain-containing protein n=1 Tax=Phaeomonas parva TaxID=124430 RepID=A0A7S1U394_9STRA|mmetsp:Transcript_29097/g.93096  ORF Transcript_29097/g.93096 Transcript_29097/m.93096 type:complete len:321 (+) Transcript_29097:62-1024(+)
MRAAAAAAAKALRRKRPLPQRLHVGDGGGGSPLYVVQLGRVAPMPMLLLEELLLRRSSENFLVTARGAAQPTIVLGISGKPAKLTKPGFVAQRGVPLLKRFSGGGTVVVDDACFFASWIVDASFAPECKPFPKEIMAYTGGVYGDVLRRSAPNQDFGEVLRENDYVIGEKKFGGNAQSIVSDRWLHHTSFLFEVRERNMELLSIPEKRPVYRADRDHGDFLVSLGDYGITMDAFEDGLVATAAALGGGGVIAGEAAKRKVLDIVAADGGWEAALEATKTRSKFVTAENEPIPSPEWRAAAVEEMRAAVEGRGFGLGLRLG